MRYLNIPRQFSFECPFLLRKVAILSVLRIRISFNADPDPAFFPNADPDPEPDPGFFDTLDEEIFLKTFFNFLGAFFSF